VKRRKVLLANVPELVGNALREEIRRQHGLVECNDINTAQLLQVVAETQSNLVIIPLLQSIETGICSHLLNLYPELHVLAVSTNASCSLLFRRKMCAKRTGPAFPNRILKMIREANYVFYSLRRSNK
jgi:hypothetical protein